MRIHRKSPLSSILLLFAPSLCQAVSLDCNHVRVDGKKFDLSSLGGPRSIITSKEDPPSVINTTFTLDICRPLKKTKGVPKEDACPSGTRVCGIERSYVPDDETWGITGVIPVAGNYETGGGGSFDPKIIRLKAADADAEGVRIEMHGGKYPFFSNTGRKQQAVFEFICDHDRTGLEGLEDADTRNFRKRVDQGLGDPEKKDEEVNSLRFKSYGPVDDIDVLRLDWLTKKACEDEEDDDSDDEKKSDGHWGFFTWFIVIAFLVTAAYLIFGSWLNYNRYGARGWDLLPHGDTIRDIPYLFKDWMRRVVNTVQGGGSRGGYSAV